MSLRALLSVPVLTIAIATTALAQSKTSNFPGKPANPGRQEMHNSYHAQGRFSNGYRPQSVWSYQNSARAHAQALNTYGQNVKKIDPQTAKEHVAEVKKNVVASKDELSKIDAEAAKKADVVQHLEALKKHYEAAEKICTKMEKAAEGGESEELCACCTGIDKELEAAELEHKKLMDALHIALPVKPGAEEKHETKK